MTGKQNAVMWLGLLLIAVRMFTTGQWSQLWGAIGKGSSGSAAETLPSDIGGPALPTLAPGNPNAPKVNPKGSFGANASTG
jgi:hypothetical protein